MLTWCVTPDTSSTWLLSGVSSGERHFEGHSAFSSSSCSISPRISSPVSSSRSATSFLITLTLACRRSLYYFHRYAHLNLYCTFFAPRRAHGISYIIPSARERSIKNCEGEGVENEFITSREPIFHLNTRHLNDTRSI